MKMVLISIMLLGFVSCATTSDLNGIEPGMTLTQVKEKIGDPVGTEFKNGAYVAKYSLHKSWKGFIPYYFVFNPKTKKLHSWYADMNEFHRNQAEWGQAFSQINQQLENDKQRQHESDLEYRKSLRSIGSQGDMNCVENGTDYMGKKQYKCSK